MLLRRRGKDEVRRDFGEPGIRQSTSDSATVASTSGVACGVCDPVALVLLVRQATSSYTTRCGEPRVWSAWTGHSSNPHATYATKGRCMRSSMPSAVAVLSARGVISARPLPKKGACSQELPMPPTLGKTAAMVRLVTPLSTTADAMVRVFTQGGSAGATYRTVKIGIWHNQPAGVLV